VKTLVIRLLRFIGAENFVRDFLSRIRFRTHVPRYKYFRFKWKLTRLVLFKCFSRYFNFSTRNDLDGLREHFRVVETNKNLIRIGSEFDGGYLIPDDLEQVAANVSLGVGTDSNFELALAERGIPSYMADGSVSGPASQSNLFYFRKVFIGEGPNSDWESFERFLTLVREEGDLILSMDIEGGEHDVLADVSDDVLNRFRIITIEFHDLDMIALKVNLSLFKKVILKLTKNHTMVHLHPNTLVQPIAFLGVQIPPVLEITFLRNDRFQSQHIVDELPRSLDKKNASWTREIYLQPEWYK
jgi:hypothetical protein